MSPPDSLRVTTIPAGVGLYLSASAIRYRDVEYAMLCVISLLVYTAPICTRLQETAGLPGTV